MYTTNVDNIISGLSVGMLIFLGIIMIIALIFCIFWIIGLWKLFKKAGKGGWEAIVPFYSTYVLVQISGLNWWYFLIAISGTIVTTLDINGLDYLCDIASIVVNAFCFYNIAKKMHQSPTGYAVAGAFVSPIVAMILGLSSKYQFDNSVSVSPNGPIGDNKEVSNNNSVDYMNSKYCRNCGQKMDDGVNFCKNCGTKSE